MPSRAVWEATPSLLICRSTPLRPGWGEKNGLFTVEHGKLELAGDFNTALVLISEVMLPMQLT